MEDKQGVNEEKSMVLTRIHFVSRFARLVSEKADSKLVRYSLLPQNQTYELEQIISDERCFG